ncbi:MAG TPA: menaquinone biosynthesis decarboxylase [Firmicutes bacterium]|nr:menaquinone biosynthesis decarboxylase [Bacillota bacterium]
MSYRDLGEFIECLDSRGLLKRIRVPVDPVLEITEITSRVCRKGGPALLFENVKGSNYPVLTNAFGSYERMKLALGVESLDAIGDEIIKLLDIPKMDGFMSRLKALPALKKIADAFPRTVKSAPCQEVIENEPDLSTLPILKCWPGDGGRFITLPLVFTKDPVTGRQNVGMYRMQVYDSRTTGMHWHVHKDGARHFEIYKSQGKRMEVAVAIGCDPATVYAATAPLPYGIDEILFSGFLRHEPVEMVKCKTIDIEVPAHAEFVLEGYVDPLELRLEGPFGDHTGYYSAPDHYPVFHVTTITRKRFPVYSATIVGRPPMEDCFIAKATERIFLPLIRLQLPEIVDMNLPIEGVFHNCAIVSIKKTYPGQAKKVMHALWGLGQMMYTKLIIVVDHDVDVHDLSYVMWKVFNNIDARRDVVLVEGPLDILDHASPQPRYGSKMGIDATKKLPEEGHPREWPDEIRMAPEIKKLVDERWNEYGIE